MENSQNNWVEDVFQSMSNSHRAQPDGKVWDAIYAATRTPFKTVRLIPKGMAIAAAMALLVINILAINDFKNVSTGQLKIVDVQSDTWGDIISDYSIYE